MKLSFEINRTKAILIGTSKYDHFIDILPVTGNLTDFAEVLTDPNIFGLPDSHITMLSEKNHDEVLINIANFLQNEDNVDIETLILYFAGHGYRTKNKELYLVTKNSLKEFIENTAVPYNVIKSLIENSNIQQRIVIIDACHSGLATMGDDDGNYTANELNIKGTYVITSSAGNEKSLFDAEKRNTFFTNELLQILKNGLKTKAQFLTLDDCFDNLQRILNEKKLPRPQRQTNLNTPNFYFFKNTKFDKKALVIQAEKYYETADYEKALQEFEIIKDVFTESGFDDKIKKCKNEIKFKNHKTTADNLFKAKKYELAINEYYKAAFVRKDGEIEKKINECENYLQIISELLEDQFWNNALRMDKIIIYQEYLEKYPTGRFMIEAEEKISQVKPNEVEELPKEQEKELQIKLEEKEQQAKMELTQHQLIESIKNSGNIELFLKEHKILKREKQHETTCETSGDDSNNQIKLIGTSGLVEQFLKEHEVLEENFKTPKTSKADIIKAIEASGLVESFLKKDDKVQKKGLFSRILKK